MQRQKLMAVAVMAAAFLVSAPGFAQKFNERTGRWTVGGDLGVTEGPTLMGLNFNVNYYITDEIAVGPLVQYDFWDDNHIFGVAGMVRYSAILANSKVVRPYGQAGIGFVNFKHEDLFSGDSKTTYLFPVGGGLEFKLNDQLALDTNVLFNLSEEIYVGLFAGVTFVF